jgi:NAD(P)-dependent dehydrogenase (short-subunit alcohol dehydrogenase family)
VARITGKACVVTAAGSGIGRATAVRLADEGGSVASDESSCMTGSVVVADEGTTSQ